MQSDKSLSSLLREAYHREFLPDISCETVRELYFKFGREHETHIRKPIDEAVTLFIEDIQAARECVECASYCEPILPCVACQLDDALARLRAAVEKGE